MKKGLIFKDIVESLKELGIVELFELEKALGKEFLNRQKKLEKLQNGRRNKRI